MRERAKVIALRVLVGGLSTSEFDIFCFFFDGALTLQFLLRFALGVELELDLAILVSVTM